MKGETLIKHFGVIKIIYTITIIVLCVVAIIINIWFDSLKAIGEFNIFLIGILAITFANFSRKREDERRDLK